MVKNILFILIYSILIGCASHDGHPEKIQKRPLSKKDYPIRIKNLTSHSFERTQDDRYKIKLKITDKNILKGNFYAEAIIDGLSHPMEYAGDGEFVYYHQIECATSLRFQFKIYYANFSLFSDENCKYDMYLDPQTGAHTITITPSTKEIAVSQEKIVFSCREDCEKCFSDNISILNKGLKPITVREIFICNESLAEEFHDFSYYLNGVTLPVSIDCGKGIALSISFRHCGHKTSGTLVIKTDNPKQPEIKIRLNGMCAERTLSQKDN